MFFARNVQITLFKPVDGGYLYRMPSPWIFAPPLRFIVNEPQRARILAMVNNPRRGAWFVFFVFAAIIWGAIANELWSLASAHPDRTIVDLIATNLIWLLPMYFVAVAILHRQRGRVERIIAAPDHD